ncbi:1,4-beta-xylanase [Oleiagrimonas sp. C23AA]|uniref:1,4-beta-xylanase n=1 Tax=Oleiagrimonas sp. C23AA TaxID=2719047 RepID=UPI001423294A|nr:1,4-beta-xylanase [Oleiagrimonas sp. C23AA]NII12196.1 1,4-beta-xylanase [Oleiagrimonas sp. C23AA]
MKKTVIGALLAAAMGLHGLSAHAETHRWSAAQAHTWYAKQKWIVGANYVPSNAINELAMWQASTFDPKRIDQELGWAQSMGMDTMRVFLHDLLWEQDPKGFKKRINTFLSIAAKHHIKPIFVLFDSCWDPDPKLGPQHPPIPGVHNSGWVQAPGTKALEDKSQYSRLEAYVKDIVGSFAHDKRVLAWDVWNEPDNPGGGNYDAKEPKNKTALVANLLPQVFAWARSQDPDQPLTSAVWHDDPWSDMGHLNAVEKTQLTQSDIISFHSYDWPEVFLKRVRSLEGYGRPIICTEYMARSAGSTIDNTLPLAKKLNIGMVNWGFVDGKEQTRYPWNSWQRPYTTLQPTIWFHDLLHTDGTPYRQREVQIIKTLSDAPRGVVPPSALMLPTKAADMDK